MFLVRDSTAPKFQCMRRFFVSPYLTGSPSRLLYPFAEFPPSILAVSMSITTSPPDGVERWVQHVTVPLFRTFLFPNVPFPHVPFSLPVVFPPPFSSSPLLPQELTPVPPPPANCFPAGYDPGALTLDVAFFFFCARDPHPRTPRFFLSLPLLPCTDLRDSPPVLTLRRRHSGRAPCLLLLLLPSRWEPFCPIDCYAPPLATSPSFLASQLFFPHFTVLTLLVSFPTASSCPWTHNPFLSHPSP